MIYSKLLKNHSDYEAYRNTSEPWAHHVSLCANEEHINFDEDIFIKTVFDVTTTSEPTKVVNSLSRLLSLQTGDKKILNNTTGYTFNTLGDNTIFFHFRDRTLPNDVFWGCTNLKSCDLPQSLTSIDSTAFMNCSNLEIDEINLPNLTFLGAGAFKNINVHRVSNLGSITTMTTAFQGSKIESIVLPETVTSIMNDAFWGCTNLKSCDLPQSLTSIGSTAFLNCRLLYSIDYSGTMAQWNSIEKHETWRNSSSIATIHCTDGDITL